MVVLVTGATGFIAQWVIRYLLEEDYDVIGTVRTAEKANKLHEQFKKTSKLSFEIVPDISKLDSFESLFERRSNDIDIVIHTASPVNFSAKNYEKDLLYPAINGTRGILECIKKYASDKVQRVVVTSSFGAIVDPARAVDNSAVFTEKDWNPVSWEESKTDGYHAYRVSKTYAELEAWKFWEENKNQVKFKLSTVNPTVIFGPQVFDEDAKGPLNTSNAFIETALNSTIDQEIKPRVLGKYNDVRDTARAHLVAFKKEEAIGKRLGVSNGAVTNQQLLDIINNNFPQLKGKISTGTEPNIKQPGGCVFDNSYSKKILGYNHIDLEKSVYDTVHQVLKMQDRL